MTINEWIVTLDIAVEATSREDAFVKVEALLTNAKAYCLYDAEPAEQDTEVAAGAGDGEIGGRR